MGMHTSRVLLIGFGIFAALLIALALLYAFLFGPEQQSAQTALYYVTPGEPLDAVAIDLEDNGYVRADWIFRIAYWKESAGFAIRPGTYHISKSMDAWTIAETLSGTPYAAWVTIPVGLRKEQVADLLADALNWTAAEKSEWLTVDTGSPAYTEGVYFPDTYLIPSNTPPAVVAQILQDRFKVAFAPYAAQAVTKGIPWTKVVTIASLIQRETGSAADMPLISGVIENRLARSMPLAIDATLQYIKGTEGNWWPTPSAAATYPDTPFNTYKHTGLPPHPIASPGLTAIAAALNPAQTSCLFYLHDANGRIHCSATYSGQLANVQKYLK